MQGRVSGRRVKLQSRLWNTSTLSAQTRKLFADQSDCNQLVSTNGVHIQDIRKKWCQCSSRERRILFQVRNIRSRYVGIRYSDRVVLMILTREISFSVIPFPSLVYIFPMLQRFPFLFFSVFQKFTC